MYQRIAKYTGWILEAIEKRPSVGNMGEVYAVGIIRALADPGTGSDLSDAERLAAIRDVLAALDQANEEHQAGAAS